MRGLLAVVACVLVAGPALAFGPGNDHTFTIDPDQSWVSLGFLGAPSYTYGVSPLAGDFVLNLTNQTLTPTSWAGGMQMEAISAASTTAFSFGFGAVTGKFQNPGDLTFTDFDENDDMQYYLPQGLDPDGPGPLPANDGAVVYGGPPISSSIVYSEVYVYGIGYLSALSPPYFTLDEWVGPAPWSVQVANDNALGVGGPGIPEVEAVLHLRGLYPVQTGTTIDFIMHLAGQGQIVVPEPASLCLLGLAGLPLLRRRR